MKHSVYIPLAIIIFLVAAWQPLGAQEVRIQAPSKSRGMPAYPFPEQVKQPDGTVITLRALGDRVLRLYETEEGYTVLQDSKGTYMYATLDAEQQLVPSGVAVSATKGVPEGIQPHLRYGPDQVDAAEKSYFSGTDSKSNPLPFPSSGTNNVLVILAEFADRAASLPPSEIESMLAAPNHNGTGSFRDYYLDVSYSNLSLEPVVSPWVQLSGNMTWYGGNDPFGYDLRPDVLVREAVDSLEASGFDFSPFDNDGDGYVDEIILVHAGYGEQYTGSGDTAIWSHAFHLGDNAVNYDGVLLDNYIICPELYGSSGTQLNTIGTVVHEFAHSLAIPDIYDVDLEGSGGYAFDPNFWDLMSVGSWNNNGITPAGINAWLKRYMGWMTIPVIDTTGIFTLHPAIDHQEAYQFNTPIYNEYFIVENRQRTGFDSYLPGEGMLVYHVDLNHPGWLTGEMNVDPAHQGFDLEEADNIRDTLTLSGDAFPGTASVTSFDSLTVPGSNTWDGNSSGVALYNITQSGDVITFEILNNSHSLLPPGWTVDELSYTQAGVVTSVPVLAGDTAISGYLGAFVGEECRGVGSAVYHTGTGRYLFGINVFSNSTGGEMLEFRYYDPVLDSVYLLYEALPFATDSIAGDTVDPFIFHTPVRYTRDFAAGWNWFSLNVDMQDMSPGAVLGTCSTPDDYVKSHVASARYYDGYGWYGKLTQLSSADLYIIKTGASCGIDAEGVPAQIPGKQRILSAGWNWVSYTPQESMPINEALASLSPTQGDYVKSQVSSATYYDGWGWIGKMAMMYPGQGYMMKVANEDVLEYPVAGSSKKAVGDAGIAAIGADEGGTLAAGFHSFVPTLYQHNGSLTASVMFDGSTNASEADVLSAWYGDEIRGQVKGMYFGPADQVLFPLMVHSNAEAGEALSFRYYHAATGVTYQVEESIVFEKDMVYGDALEAVALHADMSTGTEAVSVQDNITCDVQTLMHAWPNPFSGKVNITFTVPEADDVRLEIYDIYGNLVERIASGIFGAGEHTITWNDDNLSPGTLFIKLSAGDRQVYKRIMHVE